jgi:hypothetical protein
MKGELSKEYGDGTVELWGKLAEEKTKGGRKCMMQTMGGRRAWMEEEEKDEMVV